VWRKNDVTCVRQSFLSCWRRGLRKLDVAGGPWMAQSSDRAWRASNSVATRFHERTRAFGTGFSKKERPDWNDLGNMPNPGQNEANANITYVRLSDDFALRNSRRVKRIASNKKRITSAIAAAGAASARKDIKRAPPSSAVAMTAFPRPPVRTVE
jgi:hypothetical protein